VVVRHYRDFAKTFGSEHGKRVLELLKRSFYDVKVVQETHYSTTVAAAQHDVVGFILEQIKESKIKTKGVDDDVEFI
jgi:hypothetical protein